MNRSVAVIGTRDSTRRVNELTAALEARGIHSLLCPECDTRAMLRWIMDLTTTEVGAAIFVDSDGRLAASHAAALEPDMPAIAWAPHMQEGSHFAVVVMDAPVLVSFARDAGALVQIIMPWLGSADCLGKTAVEEQQTTPELKPESIAIPEATSTAPELSAPEFAQAPAVVKPPRGFDEHDLAALRQLEAQMATALKTKVKSEPVQIQQPGLDFSLSLRALMTAGRNLAHKNSHPEVLGAHYLTALDEPWRSALAEKGLTPGAALDYLSGLDSAEKITAEPVISEEVFEAVSRAKDRARELDHPCVRVGDFLNGLLRDKSGSMADLLHELKLSSDDLLEIIAENAPENEPCGEPFFKPSSMDQAGFYEFDASEVRNLTERLRELPAFQKAAERVAESRSRHGASLFDSTENESQPGVSLQPIRKEISVPSPPPEKPEIMRVNGEFPTVDVVENVADLLLDGQIVAFPADVMLAAAVDAANAGAVDNLREAANLAPDRPLSVLINSTSQLKHLVREDVDALEPLLEEFWPGPLTLIFNTASGSARHLSGSGTIAVRQPSDNISLAILSMLGRPLAVTSWDREPAALAGHAAAIVESEQPPVNILTTIVDVSTRPWQIIREGAVPSQAVLTFYQPRQ